MTQILAGTWSSKRSTRRLPCPSRRVRDLPWGHINAVTEQVVQGELGVAAALEQAAEKAQFELDKAHEAAQG